MPGYTVTNGMEMGSKAEENWKAIVMREKGDVIEFYLVKKGAKAVWVLADHVGF